MAHKGYSISVARRPWALPVLLALALGGLAQARTLYVTPYGTNNPPYASWADAATNIIVAVKAATNAGDEVWITNNTYVLTNTVIVTNAVTLRGIGGYPILDGTGGVRCLFFSNAAAVADSLLLTNGNLTTGSGGGVIMYGGLLTNCIITGCGRTNNIVATSGGGALLYYAAVLANCRIIGNVVTNHAGGVYLTGDSELRNCLVAANTSYSTIYDQGGGGITIVGNPRIINCTIAGNVCTRSGGGLWMGAGNWTIRNCLITANSTMSAGGQYGGGIAFFTTSTTGVVQNCSLVGNYAQTYGGGLYTRYTCSATLINTIIYSNVAAAAAAYRDYYRGNDTIVISFTNCCLSRTNDTLDIIYGTGNMTNNPAFIDVAGGNYRLPPDSPCVNYGVYQSWMDGARDLDGRQRLDRWSGLVDLGAYEYARRGTFFAIR